MIRSFVARLPTNARTDTAAPPFIAKHARRVASAALIAASFPAHRGLSSWTPAPMWAASRYSSVGPTPTIKGDVDHSPPLARTTALPKVDDVGRAEPASAAVPHRRVWPAPLFLFAEREPALKFRRAHGRYAWPNSSCLCRQFYLRKNSKKILKRRERRNRACGAVRAPPAVRVRNCGGASVHPLRCGCATLASA